MLVQRYFGRRDFASSVTRRTPGLEFNSKRGQPVRRRAATPPAEEWTDVRAAGILRKIYGPRYIRTP
jgi:ribosomal protein S19E (S16A)